MNIILYKTNINTVKMTNLGDPFMYAFGFFFIIIGIVSLLFLPRVNKKTRAFKEKQLIEYKKENPNFDKGYENSDLFLPPWERTKQFAPAFLFVIFIIIGAYFLYSTT